MVTRQGAPACPCWLCMLLCCSVEASHLVTTVGRIAPGLAAGRMAGGMLSLVSYADLGIIVVKKILGE